MKIESNNIKEYIENLPDDRKKTDRRDFQRPRLGALRLFISNLCGTDIHLWQNRHRECGIKPGYCYPYRGCADHGLADYLSPWQADTAQNYK